MTIFSFRGPILTELREKTNKWQQIYKQTNSSFYTSCLKRLAKKKILGHNNKDISSKICGGIPILAKWLLGKAFMKLRKIKSP